MKLGLFHQPGQKTEVLIDNEWIEYDLCVSINSKFDTSKIEDQFKFLGVFDQLKINGVIQNGQYFYRIYKACK